MIELQLKYFYFLFIVFISIIVKSQAKDMSGCQVSRGYFVIYEDTSQGITRGKEFFYLNKLPSLDSILTSGDILRRGAKLVNYYYYLSRIFNLNKHECLNDVSNKKLIKMQSIVNGRKLTVYNVLIVYRMKKIRLKDYIVLNEQPHSYPFMKFEGNLRKKEFVVNPEVILIY